MSKQKHTPEPWKVDEYSAGYIWGKNMEMVADLDDEEGYVVRMRGAGVNLPQEENAKRIVECVNALAGIENPAEWVQWQKNIALANAQLHSENERLQLRIKELESITDIQLAEAWEMGSVDARNKQMFQYSQGLDQDNPFRDTFDWTVHENSKLRLKVENEQLKAEINNRLTPFKNLIAMLENGLIKSTIETHELVQQEINQCKVELDKLKNEKNN